MVASFYKWLVIPFICFMGNSTILPETTWSKLYQPGIILPVSSLPIFSIAHPFYVSVTEINHNAAEKTLEISCKIFTDDMEKTLKQNYKAKIDIIQPKDKASLIKMITEYLNNHLKINVDGKAVSFRYIGNEIDDSYAYVYLQVDNITTVKNIEIKNSLLYDYIDKQVNIMHVVVNGNRKSTKLEYPDTVAVFEW
jgi:hypothetical protein